MAAGKWTAPAVRERCQARARSRADVEAATPKDKAKRAARAARRTAERRADCARRYARDCDARTDSRLAQDAPPPPEPPEPPEHRAVLRAAPEMDEDYDTDDEDLEPSVRRRERIEELAEDTGLTRIFTDFCGEIYQKADSLAPAVVARDDSRVPFFKEGNVPAMCEIVWRKEAVRAVLQFRFDAEGRPLNKNGKKLRVVGPATGKRRKALWVPRAFRHGPVMDQFHNSHLSQQQRSALYDEKRGIIGDAIRKHQQAKGEAPTFQIKWSGHLEFGESGIMQDATWRYLYTVDWGWISFDDWKTAQRWYVPSSGLCLREVFLEGRAHERTPHPCTWRETYATPEVTYHRDQYTGPQHHMVLGFDTWIAAEPRKYAWQLPFGPMRDVFDDWCDQNKEEIAQQWDGLRAPPRVRRLDACFSRELTGGERAFMYSPACDSRSGELGRVLQQMRDHYGIDQFVALEAWKIINLFYEHRSRWRTTVASWVKKRAVALYWQEATQRRLCAPGGAGRAADEADFEQEWSES